MKSAIFILAVIVVSLGFLFSGAQTMTGYYAEPSGYGFYHIWTANLHVLVSFALLGALAMVFLVKKIERRIL
ncbi:MAG: hypothetical protein KAT35_04700 [Candidatus Aenigmarchaeota archaeon]|nr:hypothetical protein [Candidatus Aenigmarchaeota archaeon]